MRTKKVPVVRFVRMRSVPLWAGLSTVDFIKGDKYADLMELRTKQSNTIFRTFYFVVVKDEERKEEKAVLLHAIQKKTDKTPQKELETALARMKEYTARG